MTLMQNSNYNKRLTSYIGSHVSLLKGMCEDKSLCNVFDAIASCLVSTIDSGNKIMICGNGGSASQANHFAAELVGRIKNSREPFAAISLSSDTSVLSCIGNDFGYERIFSRQVQALGNQGDALIALSTSGKSKNIVEAAYVAKQKGLTTIAFTGEADGNLLPELCDIVYTIPSSSATSIQEVTLTLIHILCGIIESECKEPAYDIWPAVCELSKSGYEYLLLDRDGVINAQLANASVKRWDDFKFKDSFLREVSKLSSAFKGIFVVTNQACVGKGEVDRTVVNDIHNRMSETISSYGGRIDGVYVATSQNSSDNLRKPNTGLIDLIKTDYPDFDSAKAVMVGDSSSDYIFANRLGIKYVSCDYYGN